jgi:hypothetical protein
MRVFLDDTRKEPEGWVRCFWPHEVIALVETGRVDVVSLDHDLGDDEKGTGYDVCKWLEEKVFTEGFDGDFVPPVMEIHSANPVGRDRMEFAIQWAIHHFKVCSAAKPERWEKYQERVRKRLSSRTV